MKEEIAESTVKPLVEDYEPSDILRQHLTLSTAYAKPLGAAEQALAQMWSETLRIDQVGRDDDFFELGGDSYAATVLAGQIEHDFKIQFNPADIISHATIRQQARKATAGRAGSPVAGQSSFMIACRPEGKLKPIFIVHGARGFTFFNRTFLDELGSEQPVYLFQAPGVDGRAEPLTKVADYADAYIGAMRTIQPTGPYRLAAACAGSLISLEICQQLSNAGEKVEVLILIDPLMVPKALAHLYPAVTKKNWRIKLRRLLLACRNFAHGRGFTHNPAAADWQTELKEVTKKHATILKKLSARKARGESAAHPIELTYSAEDVLKASMALDKALREYIPTPYQGRANILLNENWAAQTLRDDLFWKSHLGSIDYQVCPGTHKELFGKNVLITAGFVKKCLARPAA